MVELTQNQALDIWRRTTLEGVRNDVPNLSARQIAILLNVYMTQPPHTVRDLAATLKTSKPAVTRALDKLSGLDLVRAQERRRRPAVHTGAPDGERLGVPHRIRRFDHSLGRGQSR